MASNPFDSFDSPTAVAEPKNPFDAFDEKPAAKRNPFDAFDDVSVKSDFAGAISNFKPSGLPDVATQDFSQGNILTPQNPINESVVPESALPVAKESPNGGVFFQQTPTFTSELKDLHPLGAAGIAYENTRRLFSGLMGPTEKERIEKSVLFPDNQGNLTYQYKPLGSRMDQEAGLFTPFLKVEPMQPNESDSDLKSVGKALFNIASGVEGSLLSPGGVAMGALPASAGRVASGAFAADMATSAKDQIEKGLNSDNPQTQIEGLLGGVVTLGLAGLGVKHAGTPTPKQISKHVNIVPDELLSAARKELKADAPEVAEAANSELLRRARDLGQELSDVLPRLPGDVQDRVNNIIQKQLDGKDLSREERATMIQVRDYASKVSQEQSDAEFTSGQPTQAKPATATPATSTAEVPSEIPRSETATAEPPTQGYKPRITEAAQEGSRIVAPVILNENGGVIARGALGDTHADIKARPEFRDNPDVITGEHAFEDDKGNILNRQEAFQLAKRANQIPPDTLKAAETLAEYGGGKPELHTDQLLKGSGQPVADEVKTQIGENLSQSNSPLTAEQVSNEQASSNRNAQAEEQRSGPGRLSGGTEIDTGSVGDRAPGNEGTGPAEQGGAGALPAAAREAGQPVAFDAAAVSAYASKLPESTKNVVLNVLNKGMSVGDAASDAGTTIAKAQEIVDRAQRFIPQAKTIEPLSARSYEDQPSREARVDASEVEALKDWTSATQEQTEGKRMKRGGGEAGAISLPKFEDRKMSPLDEASTLRSAKLQKSFDEATRAQKEINKQVPSVKRQNAISVWMEAGGDAAKLAAWESAAKGKMFREASRDAQNLTPEEIAIGQRSKAAFDILAQRGLKFDVLKSGRDNYVPHVWDIEKKGASGQGSAKLQQNFRFSKARSFENFFEGDQAGFTPKTLAIGRLLPSYLHEMNRVIADRQMVQDLSTRMASDGRPLVVPRGRVYEVTTGDEGKAYLANPRAIKGMKDKQGNPIDTSDYRTLENQPALHDWRWESKDSNGNPIFMKDDLAVHPETAKRLNSILGRSAIKEWYSEPSTGGAQIPKAIVKGLDQSQSVMKREMFSMLAPFHQVQEGWHAIAHRVNPFFDIPKIDLRDAGQIDAARHGLMLLPDRTLATSYMEGVGSQGSFLTKLARKFAETVGDEKLAGKAANALANIVDGYQSYLFHQYIPGLKYKTYEAMRARNMDLHAKELRNGQLTESDVKLLSAEQTNAAYGHLNLALLDRNPTMQHLLQMGLLAPDFLEARARFTGQAFKGLVGSKVGAEQLKAIATIAAVQVAAAYALTKLGGDKWDEKHPFEVVHGGRRYTLRSVPEDIASLLSDPRQFIYGRVNPLTVKGGVQLATGLNYRGEKTTALQTAEELLAQYIPITARSIPGIRSLTETGKQSPLTPLEQLAGSLGVRVSRKSPITDTYKLASDWMDKQGVPKDKGSYPVSKYQQLRYALEDGDFDRAGKAYDELLKTEKPDKIATGFRASVSHPFTKSQTMDSQFAKSLGPSDREVYNLATRKRSEILTKFNHLRSQAQTSRAK